MSLMSSTANTAFLEKYHDFFEALSNANGLRDVIRQDYCKKEIINFLVSSDIPYFFARLIYNWFIIPFVETTVNIAQKKISDKLTFFLLQCPGLPNILLKLLQKLQNISHENINDAIVPPLTQEDLEKAKQWWLEQNTYTTEQLEYLKTLIEEFNDEPCIGFLTRQPSNSQDPLVAQSQKIDFVGRNEELEQLQGFLNDDAPFSWWTVSAPAGAGKTRLLLHFINTCCQGWSAGFATTSSINKDWSSWDPKEPTLIIIDYLYSQKKVLEQIFEHFRIHQENKSNRYYPKVRVIVLDRHIPSKRKLRSAPIWQSLFATQTQSNRLNWLYAESPLYLSPINAEDLRTIIEKTIQSEEAHTPSESDVSTSIAWLMTSTAMQRPLFAILCGMLLAQNNNTFIHKSGKISIVYSYLENSTRLPWRSTEKTEIGRHASMLVVEATALKGIEVNEKALPKGAEYLEAKSIACHILATDVTKPSLPALEPDLLGESFCLALLKSGDPSGLYEHASQLQWLADYIWNYESSTIDKSPTEFMMRMLTSLGDECISYNILGEEEKFNIQEELDEYWDGVFNFFKILPTSKKGTLWRQDVLSSAVNALIQKNNEYILTKIRTLVSLYDLNIFDTELEMDLMKRDVWVFGETMHTIELLLEQQHFKDDEDLRKLQERLHSQLLLRPDAVFLCALYNLEFALDNLIKEKQSPQCLNEKVHNIPPLILAATGRRSAIVHKFIAAGADINVCNYQNATSLHMAAQNGYADIVQLLLENGIDKNLQTYEGYTALHIAVQNGHTDIVQFLLENDIDKDIQTDEGYTALHIAAQRAYTDIVQLLLKYGVNKNACNNEGETSLYLATQEGHRDTTKMLLSFYADTERCTRQGMTALHIAALQGYTSIVLELLNANAKINVQSQEGATALYLAAQNGNVDTVKALINANANIEMRTKGGATPLHVAALQKQITTVQTLLKAGANIDVQVYDDRTALYFAVQSGHIGVVKVLLKAGANINIQANNGTNPLHYASCMGHKNIVKILLKNGADIDALDNDGCTALYRAVQNERMPIIKTLIQAGANIDTQTNPLHYATYMGYKDIVKMLLRDGANKEILIKDGFTPLHVASIEGHISIVQDLIKVNVDINTQTTDGATALHYATYMGYIDIVKILLKARANKSILYNNAKTCLDIAREQGHTAIIKLLRKDNTKHDS